LVIEPQLAAFLEEGLSIQVGTRDAELAPHGGRATAVTVEPGGAYIRVHVPEATAVPLLADLEANGHLAAAFGRPSDDRACQVKGTFVGARRTGEDEYPAVMAQWNRFLATLQMIGMPASLTARWRMWPCLSIRVRVTGVFNQTPGPGAGTSLV
jgi:hypothetical protein